ncbi:alpha/beta-Hydrolases superfamily protein [Striga asiatica]|uniref:Alpha/beta-Hydrolases superfamily protein n=1 Tax=Striga asiatica TaxID=4170 RepID=A0A5A7R4U9_STRAF|nr:alpha/beta-Hydrolases superfamily protein [Striga asiatica]
MEKRKAEEIVIDEVLQEIEVQDKNRNCENQSTKTELGLQAQHPYAFHVSGPRNVPSINWRDLINSTWKDPNYKRTVIACFIQAVYLLELDRQENRTNTDHALAPKWWAPFKYKLAETLTDERDNSIFGAILEWDRSAALADFVLLRPSGSVRFKCALKALKEVSGRYGSSNVCVAGHSLGAGFALQVGKELAKEGVCVEAHLFNPPSISLASGVRAVGEKAGKAWKRVVRSIMRQMSNGNENENGSCDEVAAGRAKKKKWVPHLYVNNSDYICCYYSDTAVERRGVDGGGGEDKENDVKGADDKVEAEAKLFVLSRGKQKFLEAHGLEQWWSEDLEMRMAMNSNSKLISRQLKSLYSGGVTHQRHHMESFSAWGFGLSTDLVVARLCFGGFRLRKDVGLGLSEFGKSGSVVWVGVLSVDGLLRGVGFVGECVFFHWRVYILHYWSF